MNDGCLDHIHSSIFVFIAFNRFHKLTKPKQQPLLISLLLFVAGDIQLNAGPTTASVQFVSLNASSVSSITKSMDKPALLQDFILGERTDIAGISETWLTPDSLQSTLNSLTPPGYTIISNPRTTGRGGGVAFIICDCFKFTKLKILQYPSFESI